MGYPHHPHTSTTMHLYVRPVLVEKKGTNVYREQIPWMTPPDIHTLVWLDITSYHFSIKPRSEAINTYTTLNSITLSFLFSEREKGYMWILWMIWSKSFCFDEVLYVHCTYRVNNVSSKNAESFGANHPQYPQGGGLTCIMSSCGPVDR
jgi:hypothetical protein